MTEPLRMNLGCGPELPAGWVNVDPVRWDTWPPYREVHRTDRALGDGVPWAAECPGLPFADGTFGGVVAHHVLQMVAWPDLVPWLTDVHRVLMPGGWLRLSVPDLVAAVAAWADGGLDWFPISDEHERTVDGKLCMYLTQAGATRSVFTPFWLLDLLHRVQPSEPGGGWEVARTQHYRSTAGPDWLAALDNRPAESLYVEAMKR